MILTVGNTGSPYHSGGLLLSARVFSLVRRYRATSPVL